MAFTAVLCEKHRVQALFGCYAALLFLGISFLVIGTHTMGQCYVKPCHLEPGLESIWGIDYGLSFATMLTGVCFAVHPAAGIVLVYIGNVGQFNAGLFVGFAALNCVNALGSCVLWASKGTMAADLEGAYAGDDETTVNLVIRSQFKSLSSIAGLYFAVGLFGVSVLSYGDSGFTSASSRGGVPLKHSYQQVKPETTPLVVQRGEARLEENPFVIDEDDDGNPTVSI